MRLLPSQTGDYEVHFLKKEFAFRDEGFFFLSFSVWKTKCSLSLCFVRHGMLHVVAFARKNELSLAEQAVISNLVMCRRRTVPFFIKVILHSVEIRRPPKWTLNRICIWQGFPNSFGRTLVEAVE